MTLQEIEADIYQQGSVGRNHLLSFLKIQDTSDSMVLRQRVSDWLNGLHEDPHYSKIQFADNPLQDKGPIEAILDDLVTYGHVHPNNVHLANSDPVAPEQPDQIHQVEEHDAQNDNQTPRPIG